MKHEEHDAQVQLMAWCNAVSCAYPDVGEYCAMPNGGARNIVTAVNLKREGVRAGMPDLFWPVPRGQFHGLFIEMKKAKGGRLSEPQRERIAFLLERGYAAEVCHGLAEAIAAVSKYFGVEIVPGHQSACFAGERKEKRGLK